MTAMQLKAGRDMAPRSSERGSILIQTALMMTVLLGVAALSVDASFAFDLRNRLAAVADAAARPPRWKCSAVLLCQHHGLRPGGGGQEGRSGIDSYSGASVDAHLCTAAGATCVAPYNTAKFVEVFLASTQSTFFGGVLGVTSLTPRARAVAGSADAVDCWVLFDDLIAKNNNDITLTGCGLSVGDDILLGGSSITAASVGVGDVCVNCGDVTPTPVKIPIPADPLNKPARADRPLAPLAQANWRLPLNMTLNPGKYCGWDFDGKHNVTLNPGTYYITGPITVKNGGTDVNLVGSGVMIYLALRAPTSTWARPTTFPWNLSAPTSGPYSGILFYQDR